MSTPGTILTTVRRIDDVGTGLKRKESAFKGELRDGRSWWQGDAHKSLETGFVEIEKEINKLYRGIDNLKAELKRLSADVQRAEDEERRKKLDQAKKGKS